MNRKKACDILELNNNFTYKELRSSYHKKILKHHPDKGNTNNSIEFIKINEAYKYLNNETFINDNSIKNDFHFSNNGDIKFILHNFFKNITKNTNINNVIIEKLVEIVSHKYKNISNKIINNLLDKIEDETLVELYTILNNYKDIIDLPINIITRLEDKIRETVKCNEVITINPSIEDLLNHNVYLLEHNNNVYNIPLWHSKLFFKDENREKTNIIVICDPDLPDHIFIDEKNNIHISLRFKVDKLIKRENINFQLGNRIIPINIQKLMLKDKQEYIIKSSGIARINNNNMFSIEKMSDIVCHIELY